MLPAELIQALLHVTVDIFVNDEPLFDDRHTPGSVPDSFDAPVVIIISPDELMATSPSPRVVPLVMVNDEPPFDDIDLNARR